MATVPIATFVMVTEPLGDRLARTIGVPYAISDIQMPTNYYRPLPDGRLLWGGRVQAWEPSVPRIAAALKRDMVAFYPDLATARVETAWGGLMPYLRNKMPSFGQLKPGLWYATGFGGLGLALTSTAGRLIAAGIAEGDDRWRLFAKFGLPFAGGSFGRVPAQLVYWRRQVAARMGRFRNL
jgi:gamma-glutamylputrescine oxidase